MKRYGYLYERVHSTENLYSAFHNAQKNKSKRKEVLDFAANLKENILEIQHELITQTYQVSPYQTFIQNEPKTRVIYKLPFKDRVVHWAIMQVIEPIWHVQFTADTYSCIRGRGVHSMVATMKRDIDNNPEETKYCLKIDIAKFYPSINHEIMKAIFRRKIKDPKMLWLLDLLVDSTDGVPIGNYTSQFFANLYLSELDHLLKEELGVKFYYRYSDDIVILSHDKKQLHAWLVWINHYLVSERKLFIKDNFSIFPITNGIDFGGYVTYPTHILARKRNKQKLCRQVAMWRKKGLTDEEIRLKESSRLGFMTHCDSNHLLKTIGMKKFSEIRKTPGRLDGDKLHIDKIIDKTIRLTGFHIGKSRYQGKLLTLQYFIEEEVTQEDGSKTMEWVKHISFTGSKALINVLQDTDPDDYPVLAKVVKQTINDDKGNFFYNIVDPDD